MNRRDLMSMMLKGIPFAGLGGIAWDSYAKKAKENELVLRPPGALEEKDFARTCIKCGSCVNACPPKALKLAEPTNKNLIGSPYFEPRKIPCSMCTHIPCVPVCSTGALDKKRLAGDEKELDINKAKMGVAVVDQKSCLAYWGIQCDACYRACPLIDNAITIEMDKSKVTGKHARQLPIVDPDVCTGCGICEHACITEKAAIFVLPRHIALGEVGDHYLKSWEKNQEQKEFDATKNLNKDEQKAIDYLNTDDLLDED